MNVCSNRLALARISRERGRELWVERYTLHYTASSVSFLVVENDLYFCLLCKAYHPSYSSKATLILFQSRDINYFSQSISRSQLHLSHVKIMNGRMLTIQTLKHRHQVYLPLCQQFSTNHRWCSNLFIMSKLVVHLRLQRHRHPCQ